IVVASPIIDRPVNKLLRRIYELYADFALKNPFYSIDMPIRADKFNEAIRNVVQQHEK
ncbi:UNVERIFIED_CONTAM: Trafficking protein particle complex subunit 4, partial [Eudyptes robustus]